MRREHHQVLYEDDPDYVEVWPDGTTTRGVRKTYTHQDQIGMLREGYLCVRCDEMQPSAFPDACLLCGFPMKDEQTRYFEDRFAGQRVTGGLLDWDEEQDRLERQRHDRELAEGLRSKGVVLPRSVS